MAICSPNEFLMKMIELSYEGEKVSKSKLITLLNAPLPFEVDDPDIINKKKKILFSTKL